MESDDGDELLLLFAGPKTEWYDFLRWSMYVFKFSFTASLSVSLRLRSLTVDSWGKWINFFLENYVALIIAFIYKVKEYRFSVNPVKGALWLRKKLR